MTDNPSEKQPASTYPFDFDAAALPQNVDANQCEHDPPHPVGQCVHDWRIHWGELDKTAIE